MKGQRSVFLEDSWQQARVYDGSKLGPGAIFSGPSIVEEKYTTILVPTNFQGKRDKFGNVLLVRTKKLGRL